MTRASWDRIWPIGPALLVGGLAILLTIICNVKGLPLSVPAASMTFGVVVSGFVATQRNMLLTMSGTEVMRFAVRTGYHRAVISYLMDGVRVGLLVTGISLPALLLDQGGNTWWWRIWLSGLGFCIALVVGVLVRNEMLVSAMIRTYLETKDDRPRSSPYVSSEPAGVDHQGN